MNAHNRSEFTSHMATIKNYECVEPDSPGDQPGSDLSSLIQTATSQIKLARVMPLVDIQSNTVTQPDRDRVSGLLSRSILDTNIHTDMTAMPVRAAHLFLIYKDCWS